MKNLFSTLAISFILISVNPLYSQKQQINDYYTSFTKYYSLGDFINAEKFLNNILKAKDSLPKDYLIAIYNNLGVINYQLGRYEKALNIFNSAESLFDNPKRNDQSLADIYINKARIYGILREYKKAIEYLEQGVKIYNGIKNPEKSTLFRISTAYLNLGLTYFEEKKFKLAFQYLEKSQNLKLKFNLSELALTQLNLAKTYVKTNNSEKAQLYFEKSIDSFNKEFGKDSYRKSSVLFDYGLFLESIGKNKEALETFQKALSICLKNYGAKHTFVSLAYKHLGDHFFNLSDYQTSLNYYQKSLIAVVSDFNDSDIFSNPSLNSVIFNIRLLDNLKQKAKALEFYSLQQDNVEKRKQILMKSYETIDLALQMIAKIRSGYMSGDSKIYLAENEKETYIFATHISQQLFELTKNSDYLQKMYAIALHSKSAILQSEITENNLLYRKGIPDSLHGRRNQLLVNISSYNKLIQDELQKTKPDTQKVDFWKNALFNLNRSKEIVDEDIKGIFPQYESLIGKNDSVSIKDIQNNLKSDETLIEYILSNHYSAGKRELYIYTITNKKLDYHLTYLDSSFTKNVESLKHGTEIYNNTTNQHSYYRSYTDALYYMYDKLIRPVEQKLSGKKLIIVPDEEIAFLPFDAFIKQKPDLGYAGFEGLSYLIFDYTFSYGYSSLLIFGKEKNEVKTSDVYAFSPDYDDVKNDLLSGPKQLQGTSKEIGAIFENFNGKAYYGENATEKKFKLLSKKPAIFHLAMHSQVDSSNSKYSFLIFNSKSDTVEDGKLYNYEISVNRIVSPMVVLSACNTGTGNLYHGEGVMSLARGFILAGASSVINTFWNVNDDASANIMIDFYHNLSKGFDKDDALRMAKLNYLKHTPPTYANPYFWAAYEVMGDKSSIKKNGKTIYFLLLGTIIVLSAASYVIYLRRLRRS